MKQAFVTAMFLKVSILGFSQTQEQSKAIDNLIMLLIQTEHRITI